MKDFNPEVQEVQGARFTRVQLWKTKDRENVKTRQKRKEEEISPLKEQYE